MVNARNISIIKNQGGDTTALSDELAALGHTVTVVLESVQQLALADGPLAQDLYIIQISDDTPAAAIDPFTLFKAQGIPFLFITDSHDLDFHDRLLQTGPAAVLTRPLHPTNLRDTIELAPWPGQGLGATQLGESLFVKSNNLLVQVKTDEILYIHAEGNYCNLITRTRRLLLKMSMNQLRPMLPARDFVQVHRNYIVRLTEVESISLTDSELSIHGDIIPVSKTKFRDALLARVKMVK